MKYLTEIEERDGVLWARVYAPSSGTRPLALLAAVPTPAGADALRELLRLTLERGFVSAAEA